MQAYYVFNCDDDELTQHFPTGSGGKAVAGINTDSHFLRKITLWTGKQY